MMRLLIVLFAVLMLTGCPGTMPIQHVDNVVAVSCIKTVPAKPAYPAVPKKGIFDQAKAVKARDKMRQDYERELEAVIEACR